MSNMIIDWDAVPDIITKEKFYKLCHISKSTAMQLLRSGKVPCEYSGSRTHCYKIRKEDVRTYFENREIFPELYAAPKGWYCDTYDSKITGDLPDYIQSRMRCYYIELMKSYPDEMKTMLAMLAAEEKEEE